MRAYNRARKGLRNGEEEARWARELSSDPSVENNGVAMDQSEGLSTIASMCSSNFRIPSNIEESCATSKTPKIRNTILRGFATRGFVRRKINYVGADIDLHHFSKYHKGCIGFRIHDDDDGDAQIDIEGGACLSADKTDIESMKVELACLYFLHLPSVNTSKGLFPIIKDMKYDGKVIESLEAYDTIVNGVENILIEVSLDGWVCYRHIKCYVDCCKELLETPNMKLMKKLYISGEKCVIDASECDLQDESITPLINAVHKQKFITVLDLSHNTLGTETMEKLQELFLSDRLSYRAFALDFHCNGFGASALNQICECPAFFSGLHVLNISGNRLTDECGIVLSALIQKCRALHTLNISECSITSRTVEKMADVITSGLVLEHLSIGYNDLSGSAIVKLLTKLASLERFQELNLNGIAICRLVIDSLCKLAERPHVSRLMLRGSNIGNDGAVQLTNSLFRQHHKPSVKLDLSYCNLTDAYIHKLKSNDIIASGFTELIYEGNTVREEGMKAMTSLVRNRECGLRVVVLNKCELEVKGVARVMEALSEKNQVGELHLSYNISLPISLGDVEELSRAIGKAKWLQMLDLSHNGIQKGAAEALFRAWAPRLDAETLFGAWASRSGTRLHFQDHTLHFSTYRTPCCRICCPYSRPPS